MKNERTGAGNIEKNLPAEQKEAEKQTRLHASDVNEIGQRYSQEEKSKGPEKTRACLIDTASSNNTAQSSTHPMSPDRVFHRLHRKKDILRVFRKGRRMRSDSFDVISLHEDSLRIAVVVPLYGMRAVDRNRVRRRTKEALTRGGFLEGLCGAVVVRARKPAYDRSFMEITEELRQTFTTLRRKGGG